MYSRYTPNENGGYDRRELPDAADLRLAQSRPPPPGTEEHSPPPPQVGPPAEVQPGPEKRGARQPEAPPAAGKPGPEAPRFAPPPSPDNRRPLRIRPGPPSGLQPPPPLFGGLLGPGGLLSQLLPHGLDSEDLLILAILLLCMKQDGAGPTELMIAAGLYFWL